ncbi:MAG: tRNA pseudouridine(55) synthase TruB [Planctomycetota bacterium]|nr:tRNA pseudouridine(55) synthase TruB [Planctomycetota bacterium]
MDGVINIDKPAGMSSAAVVGRVKRLLPRGVKVGHAGTLDPFATGVLVVLVGKATRLAERFMSEPKQYAATIKLGATTETLDPESEETVTEGATALSREAVEEVLRRFVGELDQKPPVYSALKIHGKAAYRLAREGKAVELGARRVKVYGIELTGYEWPMVEVKIDCGRGTYIRSIARDVGQALGMGGYLVKLRRTRVGSLWAERAVGLQELERRGVTVAMVQTGD